MNKNVVLLLMVFTSCRPNDNFDAELASLLKGDVPFIYTASLENEIKDQDLLLFDARSFEEYQVSHLPGAVFIGYSFFLKGKVGGYDKNKKVVVYCSVGYRSEKIGRILQKMGFSHVRNLYGGVFDWKNRGNAVVNKKGEETDSVHTYNKKWSRWLKNGIKVYE